ncbi:MFS transporter [Pseudoalteromonas fenneropenaei]|uniref:MFS transporter n=1 Tax=Pseudoalteromonas fenneropenaei TaxID=1737459 RepID=A0ABV7CJJ5_9GAMM
MQQDSPTHSNHAIRWLTFMMFLMFAMTSDAVGVIIPTLIKDYNLSMTEASAFHYAPMIMIALSGLGLGFLADKLGRKATILIGLGLFALSCFLFAIGDSFAFFVVLLGLVGTAIGLFKTGAIALLGDISTTSKEHTKTMNQVEGFFAVGAIIGPAACSFMLAKGVSWTYLYVAAAVLCLLLIVVTAKASFPKPHTVVPSSVGFAQTLAALKDPLALFFSLGIALYVATEVAIYVWMPTLLLDYQGDMTWLAAYALTLFFILRAIGRFLAVWLLNQFRWQTVMVYLSAAISLCYLATLIYGVNAAVFALPLCGLFMSMIYPTLNSKGISCFAKHQHGSIAGVILFFTAVAAAVAPFLMGVVSDHFGHVKYGFYLATGFAIGLFLLMLFNWLRDPSAAKLAPHALG